MQRAMYSCTALVGTNKSGRLKADSNGYREVVLGALNFENSAGEYYAFDHAKDVIEGSNELQRRIKNGQLRGEYGHPKRHDSPSARAWLTRVATINEDRISHHLKAVWFDAQSVKDEKGKKVIAIMGAVRPCGPHGDALSSSFENHEENVAFSIRSFTRDLIERGRVTKYLARVFTWDYVNEPGLSVATKYSAPALESITSSIITPGLLNEVESFQASNGIGIESGGLDVAMVRSELGWQKVQVLDRTLAW